MDLNFYEVLDIKTDATEKDIKKAYRLLAKKYHPDTYSGDKSFAQEKMQEINAAYDTLSDDILRKKYDEKIGVNIKKAETTSYEKTSTYSNKHYYNTYNKSGVNYEVKYRPNNSKIRYDAKGYAESNYYTTKIDEEEYYKNYDINYKKTKIKELFSGKKLICTLIITVAVIATVSLLIYKAVENISNFIKDTKAISHDINSAKEDKLKKSEKEREELKKEIDSLKQAISPKIDAFYQDIKIKEEQAIDAYKKNNENKDKKEILEGWGITDSKEQQEILDYIESLNKN